MANKNTPLIKLENIVREFPAGDSTIQVLKSINLTINAGEMVAIIGASGSGKSTLMNILGCLDKPTTGTYSISGRITSKLSPDELAELRREHFGFIFQRYHLLNALTAQGNVEIPAIYAGVNDEERQKRATEILTRLGLADKIHNKPNQLSGGQQQRVSIGRALINGGQIILADEPTGALDRKSGLEVMAILRELHSQGHTVIIVTHDANIAQSAQRIIEISDGNIISDSINPNYQSETNDNRQVKQIEQAKTQDNFRAKYYRFRDAFKMAILSMFSQRLRTFLTMLGIIIGIASVVSMVALGQGTKQKILSNINSMGTSTLEIYAGNGFGDRNADKITTLRSSDADFLAQQSFVHSTTPNLSTSVYFRINNLAVTGTVNGVGEQFFAVRGYDITQGTSFDQSSINNSAQDAVIDENTVKRLFANEDPIGKILMVGQLPVKIIGVATKQQQGFGSNESLNVWLPYTTVINRMVGQTSLRSITVRINDNIDLSIAEQAVNRIMLQRHGTKDFFIFNSDNVRETINSSAWVLTLLVSTIALISLIVGGIGVMNIMLVSVTERTREIGVRMAVGARSSDILQQFLIEAVLVCLTGGIIGILLSFVVGFIFNALVTSFAMSFSSIAIVAAFSCSSIIGIIFGYFPAKRAAKLDPIYALERE
ncbi:macrolide ABC transporter permease/ATP-binding protein MacB [Gilliamella apicola]|uniref:MacB family efflux pump subunit n=1 Tax=Gilliamella TaxID=1193503 RepID=UPI0008103E74|nr:MacB family efflux pump subunit [Gilliamella apicola]OCF92950.1 macrolide ABC transporter permease/ATP-binding protein MacB [Gilliamella apicola]OTP87417.1 macrolide ABC transporter permease/ATP-binding protein MacB [Gilliamella apicola]OTP96359.1 macrolide ABC transporter permease/ATP-binding protein MacB [Gilliamella apicola]OTP97522.1 macrolide ABC transporter permease/ATP-binding protein MacB [Gilliamella apicola]OTP99570.1 macrolide ABC transporter permease/ATP-binding protein MacB [Gi